jgi:hypothetical protein
MRVALRAPVLWISVTRVKGKGPGHRDYVLRSDAGDVLLEATVHPWRRETVVRDSSGAPAFAIRRRRSFPVSGKVDIVEMPVRRRIGIVTRGGRIVGADGRVAARLRDARKLGEKAGEAAYLTVLEALLGGEGNSVASGPSGYVYVVGEAPVGTLARAKPPFESGNEAGPARGLKRLVPARLRDRARSDRAWKLERPAGDPNDPVLIVAAALFAVEISHW